MTTSSTSMASEIAWQEAWKTFVSRRDQEKLTASDCYHCYRQLQNHRLNIGESESQNLGLTDRLDQISAVGLLLDDEFLERLASFQPPTKLPDSPITISNSQTSSPPSFSDWPIDDFKSLYSPSTSFSPSASPHTPTRRFEKKIPPCPLPDYFAPGAWEEYVKYADIW